MIIPTWKEILHDAQAAAARGNNTRIATGLWRSINTYIDAGYIPISICGRSPDGYKGCRYEKLAPKYLFFANWKNGKISDDEYIWAYNEQILVNLDPKAVHEELMDISDHKNVVLCCYEKPFDFCHRHLVSYWLRKNGIDVAEFTQNQLIKGLLSK